MYCDFANVPFNIENNEVLSSEFEYKYDINKGGLDEEDIIHLDKVQLNAISSTLKVPSIELEKLNLKPSDIILVRDFPEDACVSAPTVAGVFAAYESNNAQEIKTEKKEEKYDEDEDDDKTGVVGFYPCDICNENFLSDELLHTHRKKHKRSKCCSARYLDDDDNGTTTAIQNNYECGLCHQTFSPGYSSKKHIRLRNRERPFSCDFCNAKFTQWGNLRLHIQRHLGVNPYRCPFCDKAYIVPSKLELHLRCHTNERPSLCRDCRATFKTHDDLRKHEMAHTNYKPFTCWLCQKSFMQPPKLKQHMKEKHFLNVIIAQKDITDKGIEYEINVLS